MLPRIIGSTRFHRRSPPATTAPLADDFLSVGPVWVRLGDSSNLRVNCASVPEARVITETRRMGTTRRCTAWQRHRDLRE
jgi:hypothetical protein